MATATYARYSSDRQRKVSIQDQIRITTRKAEQEGLSIDLKYSDEAISGSTTNRPGYQQMLADAAGGKFTTLILDDMSRLSRDQVEREQVIRRMEFQGIRIIGTADGYDSCLPKTVRKTNRAVKSLIDEMYLDDLAHKTHRGLEGQAIAGNNCGGKSYGYKSAPIEGDKKDQFGRPEIIGATREIDPEEANWVLRIFKCYADGQSPRQIAYDLNAQGVKSPRGSTWGMSAIYGDMKRGLGLLNNPLYIGQYIWNRSRWVKDPDTGSRKRQERPESEWIINDMPQLRIIPQELWNQVKARQRAQQEKTQALKERHGNQARGGRGPKYIFSGLLRCNECGGNFIIVDRYRYGCARHKDRGPAACGNDLKVSKDLVESTLLEGIQQALLQPELIQEFTRSTTALLNKKRQRTGTDSVTRQLETVQKEIENIMKAIRAGIITPSTKAELEKAEATRDELENGLKQARDVENAIATALPTARERYIKLVKNLGKSREVSRIRSQIRQLIGETITLRPANAGDHLIAVLDPSIPTMIGMESKLSLVAGRGFEPLTFGL